MKLLASVVGVLLLFLSANPVEAKEGEVCGGIGGVPCGSGEFCSLAVGVCGTMTDPQGVCVKPPEICPRNYDPVCGCDGQTYGNACEASSNSVSIAHERKCTFGPTLALCPGPSSYSASTHSVGGHSFVTLTAHTTLPTLGWNVGLRQRPETIIPPMYDFVCAKPTGIVPQVVTDYTATTVVHGANFGDEISVRDDTGETLVPVSAGGGSAVGHQECKDNKDCTGQGEFCDRKRCGKGTCKKKPEICTRLYMPVMTCADEIFPNACEANSEGESVKKVLAKPEIRSN